MPVVDVTLLEGKSAAHKAEFIKQVTDSVVNVFDLPPSSVTVVLREVPATDYGVAGKSKAKPQAD